MWQACSKPQPNARLAVAADVADGAEALMLAVPLLHCYHFFSLPSERERGRGAALVILQRLEPRAVAIQVVESASGQLAMRPAGPGGPTPGREGSRRHLGSMQCQCAGREGGQKEDTWD